jgi:phytol kinase
MTAAAELIARFLPDALTVKAIAPLALGWGVLAAAAAAILRRRGVRTAYTRKVFHFLIFTVAGLVHLAWALPGVVVYGTVISLLVLLAVARGAGDPFSEALARPADAPRRTLFIIVPLVTTALGGVIANVISPGLAYVGYLVCGWGDAAGEPVGSRFGHHHYRVHSLGGVPATRTLEGSAAVWLVGSAAALLGLLVAGYPPASAFAVGLACGAAGALVEAVSTHGLDNLTVQVAATALAALLL